MEISNTQSIIIGALIMLLGYGFRSKGYKIPGNLAIAIGAVGIPFAIWWNDIKTFVIISSPIENRIAFSAIGICFIGVLLIVWHNIYRKRSSLEMSGNNSVYFPRLNLNILEEFARRFVEKHFELPVSNITLYRYHYDKSSDDKQKYALVYEVDSKAKQSDILRDKIVELQELTGWISGKGDVDMKAAKKFGIDGGFADLYVETPTEDCLKEWNFYVKTTDEKMPIGIMGEEKSLVLYRPTT